MKQTKGNNQKNMDIKDSNQFELLTATQEWIKIQKLWSLITEINNKSTLQLTRAYPSELLIQLKELIDDLNKQLDSLVSHKLLSSKEKQFLSSFIKQRYTNILQKKGVIMCYISTEITEERKTLEDLEKRYNILNSLYADNKISNSAFEEAKKIIFNDVAFLQSKITSTENSIETNESFLELITELNKQ